MFISDGLWCWIFKECRSSSRKNVPVAPPPHTFSHFLLPLYSPLNLHQFCQMPPIPPPSFGVAVPHGWQLACGRALWSGRDPGSRVSVPASPGWDFNHFSVFANGWGCERKHLKHCLILQRQIVELHRCFGAFEGDLKTLWRNSSRIWADHSYRIVQMSSGFWGVSVRWHQVLQCALVQQVVWVWLVFHPWPSLILTSVTFLASLYILTTLQWKSETSSQKSVMRKTPTVPAKLFDGWMISRERPAVTND